MTRASPSSASTTMSTVWDGVLLGLPLAASVSTSSTSIKSEEESSITSAKSPLEAEAVRKRKLNERTVRPCGLPLLVAQRQGGLLSPWDARVSTALGTGITGSWRQGADTIVTVLVRYMLLKPAARFKLSFTSQDGAFQYVLVPTPRDGRSDSHDG